MAPFPLMTLLGLLIFIEVGRMLPKDIKPDDNNFTVWANFRTVMTFVPTLACLSLSMFASTTKETVDLLLWGLAGRLVRLEYHCSGHDRNGHRPLGAERGGTGFHLRRYAGKTACRGLESSG
jgi:hypothetical protein